MTEVMWSNLPTVAFLVVKLAAVFEVPVNAAFLALVYLLQMHLALLLASLQLGDLVFQAKVILKSFGVEIT